MKCKDEPCPDDEHDFYDNYFGNTWCSTPYCDAGEYHCRKCGWFISSCLCGAENGASKVSSRWYEASREMRSEAKKRARALTRLNEMEGLSTLGNYLSGVVDRVFPDEEWHEGVER